ncbi:MAG: SWIM zinc finger family protein [Acidobacteria bacterium]|nr:SWIM zinc finger family protein [Acidobacteriota bacterium]
MNDTLNIRELRGLDISKRYTIKEENGFWFVPSASGKSQRYKVCLKSQKCTCPDFEIRRQKCKHIFAVEYHFEQNFLGELTTKEVVIPQTYIPTRKTYSQDWVSYDKAQRSEKSEFQFLLAELCKGIGEPSQVKGRPRLPLEDMIFTCVFKVYSLFSLRRFNTDLKEAHAKGFLLRSPHYKSISRYFANEMLTPYLKMLIEESSLPLAEIEKHFAVDASGLSTSQGFTWLHAYIAWKANSRATNKEGNHLWNKLYHYYALNQDKFLEHYHKRSNVETAFFMIKAKFGGSLRSKTRTAQINEALCKILAHNICVLNQSMFELGIKPDFYR